MNQWGMASHLLYSRMPLLVAVTCNLIIWVTSGGCGGD